MSKKRFAALSSALTAVGGIIGAGFAGGREIFTFFRGENRAFFVGGAVFVIMFVFSLVVFRFGEIAKISSLNDFSEKLAGKHSHCLNAMYLFCFYIVLAAMMSAVDELFSFVGTKFPIFSIAAFLFSSIFVVRGIDGIDAANFFLTPLLVLFIALITLNFKSESAINVIESESPHVAVTATNALMYVSMNFCLASVVMAEEGKSMKKREAALSSLIVSSITGILVGFFVAALSKADFATVPIPLTKMSERSGTAFFIISVATLLFSIITTVLASYLPIYAFWSRKAKGKFTPLAATFIPAFLLSRFGFIKILSAFYPIQSVVGLIAFVLMLHLIRQK